MALKNFVLRRSSCSPNSLRGVHLDLMLSIVLPCLLHMIPCPEWCDWCSKFWSPQEGNKVIVVFNGRLLGGSAKTKKCNKLFPALFPWDPLNFWEYDGWGSSSKFPLLAIFWRAASPTFFSGYGWWRRKRWLAESSTCNYHHLGQD